MTNRADRRVLGAFRFMDATTGVPIARPLEVSAPGLTLYYTRSNLYVIMDAEGLSEHTRVFDAPPNLPANDSLDFRLTVNDHKGHFLPRIASLSLPRAFNPGGNIRDLQTPIDIDLASGAARPANPGWAVVEMRIRDQSDAPIRGALVEVFPEGGGNRLAWSIANRHGEARLPIVGLRPFQEIENDPLDDDDNEIITSETRVEVRATVDLNASWPPDPDAMSGPDPAFRRATLPLLALTPGRTNSATLALDLS